MKKDKESDAIIRRGDYVRLKTPRRFLRCGYDLDHQEVMEYLERDRRKDIDKVKEIFGCENSCSSRADEKLINALAFMIISGQQFGGKERKLFTAPTEIDRVGKKYLVRSVYMVRTGSYYGPAGGQSYEGEYWYEPGGLEGAKSIKVVQTSDFVELKHGNFLLDLEGVKARRKYKESDPTVHLTFLAEDVEKIVPGDPDYVPRQDWQIRW